MSITNAIPLTPTNTWGGLTVIPVGDLEAQPVVLAGTPSDGKLYRIDPASGTVTMVGPFTGGYRVADPRRVASIASGLRPDVIEVSDRLTLRGMGRWASRRDIRSVMISHERLDRLLAQTMPMRYARPLADAANRRTAESYDAVVCTTEFAQQEFDRIGTPNVHRVPLGVDLELFHPRRRRAGA